MGAYPSNVSLVQSGTIYAQISNAHSELVVIAVSIVLQMCAVV